jgi:hypothetical protein
VRQARGAAAGINGAVRREHAVLRARHRDGFREPGFSKECRLRPQISIGLLTDATGFPSNFRMSKHDLRARPIYHGEHDSIEANLSIVFAVLAVDR